MADLKQFWQSEMNRFAAAQTALATRAGNQSDALKAARATLATKQADILAGAKDIAAKRAAFAEAELADGAALLTVLETLVIAQRKRQGELLDLGEAVAAAEADLAITQAAQTRTAASLTAADAGLAKATAEGKIRDDARAAITAQPLAGIAAAANGAKTGPEQTAAKVEIDKLPAELLALATKQLERQRGRVTDAVAASEAAATTADAEAATSGGEEGKASGKARLFRKAEAKVLWIAGSAQTELARARALFVQVSTGPLLTTAEQTAAAVSTARTDASTAADAIVDAAVTADQAARDYEAALLAAQAPDPDANVSAVVAPKKTASDTAAQAVATKRGQFTEASDLAGWTVVVPDSAWQKVQSYLEAMQILTRLAGLPGSALADLTAAETAYADALAAVHAAERRRAYLQDVAAAREARRAQLAKGFDVRGLSTLRDDAV